MRRLFHPTTAILVLALAAQVALWAQTRHVRPPREILDAAPSALALEAVALGERELLYRALALELQNAGDTGGRTTPLAAYDLRLVATWLRRLDGLNHQSQYAPVLAALYFGRTQRPDDLGPVIDYLIDAVPRAPEARWRYLVHAVFLARHRLHDQDRALKAARVLAALPVADLPVWARQMPALILADMGEKDMAVAIVQGLIDSDPDLPADELRELRRFLEDTLSRP